MELNRVFLIGNLTRDPETRYTPSGAPVCRMGLAVNRRSSSRDGERREETLFIDVEAWSRTAELCQQFLKRGSMILVEGRLKLDQWTTPQGDKRSRIFVVADRVQFGPRSEGAGGGQQRGSDASAGSRHGGGRESWQQGPPAGDAGGGFSNNDDYTNEPDAGYSDAGTEDDLPF